MFYHSKNMKFLPLYQNILNKVTKIKKNKLYYDTINLYLNHGEKPVINRMLDIVPRSR